jgi:4-alpha-glucanotransferase
MRWERDGAKYRDPRAYPASSLATTGTHDTEPVVEWWEAASDEERREMARAFPEFEGVKVEQRCTPFIHNALLAAALNSGSDLCVLPWQDVLGTRDRINLPGSMSDSNWAYRIAEDVSALLTTPQTRDAAQHLARLSVAGRR